MLGAAGGQWPDRDFIGGWVSMALDASRLYLSEKDEHGQPLQVSLQRLRENRPPGRARRHAGVAEEPALVPWVRERVEAGTLVLHGWWFDLDTGDLWATEPGGMQLMPVLCSPMRRPDNIAFGVDDPLPARLGVGLALQQLAFLGALLVIPEIYVRAQGLGHHDFLNIVSSTLLVSAFVILLQGCGACAIWARYYYPLQATGAVLPAMYLVSSSAWGHAGHGVRHGLGDWPVAGGVQLSDQGGRAMYSPSRCRAWR